MLLFKKQSGMSMLELVIGITLAMIIMIFAFEQFMPWLAFRQKFMTELKMDETQSSLHSLYRAKSIYIDAEDYSDAGTIDYPEVSGTVGGRIFFSRDIAGPSLITSCDNETSIGANKTTLSKMLGNSDADFGRDAYGQDICFFVTKANVFDTGSVKLYYHTILLISKGRNGKIDTKVDAATGVFSTRDPQGTEVASDILNDDIVRVVNGYSIQREKFELAIKKLETTSKAFENYFQIQFLTDITRDLMKDYFASSVSGSTTITDADYVGKWAPKDISIIEQKYNTVLYRSSTRDSLNGTVIQSIWHSVFSKLGLGLDDVQNPWVVCSPTETEADCANDFIVVLMDPNNLGSASSTAISTDFQSAYEKIRSPLNGTGNFGLPPYNVVLAMDYPGRLNGTLNPGNPFILKSALAKY